MKTQEILAHIILAFTFIQCAVCSFRLTNQQKFYIFMTKAALQLNWNMLWWNRFFEWFASQAKYVYEAVGKAEEIYEPSKTKIEFCLFRFYFHLPVMYETI